MGRTETSGFDVVFANDFRVDGSVWYYGIEAGDGEAGLMTVIEQMREQQEAIANRFHTQPMNRGQFSDTARRAAVDAVRTVPSASARRPAKSRLPAPSREVKNFLVRAIGNPAFRSMIERLAHE